MNSPQHTDLWKLPLEKRTNQPLYRQIIALIENALENGLIGGEERLPSERKLAALLGVNRSTVLRAIQELTDRGILLRRLGSGTYVNGEKWGLQHYPILNWREPLALRAAPGYEEYTALVTELRRSRGQRGVLRDLSSNDMAASLLPTVVMPEAVWQEVLVQELDDESSLVGLRAFQKTIRRHLRENLGLHVPEEQILVTSGAQQALFLITQSLLRPGDVVGIEAPSYFYSLPVFQAAGLRLFAIPMDEQGITLDGLDALAARRDLKMIFLNPVFQNPTGIAMSEERKRDVLHYCSARRIPIVEDDAYSLLAFSRAVPVRPIKALDNLGQVLLIGSLSSYVGKNVRAGWLVAPGAVVAKLAAVRRQMDAGLSVLPQLVAGHYLNAISREHLAWLRETLRQRATALRALLETMFPDLELPLPSGGIYTYLRPQGSRNGSRAGMLEHLLRSGLIPARGAEFGDTSGGLRLNHSQWQALEEKGMYNGLSREKGAESLWQKGEEKDEDRGI